jgi:putative DNA primase/helicase
MSPAPIDFSAINAAALADGGFLQRLLPGGRFEANEYVSRNPTRADSNPGSFKINLNTGVWSDFATRDRGGDLIDLCKYVHGHRNLADAAREVAEMVGVPVFSNGGSQKPKAAAAPPDNWVPITPIPANAPPLRAEKFCPDGFKRTKTWEFS